MKYVSALACTFTMLTLMALAAALAGVGGAVDLMMLSSVVCGWVSYSSKMYRHNTGLPENPVAVTLVVALLWIVGFPWFIAAWYDVTHGGAILRPGWTPPTASLPLKPR